MRKQPRIGAGAIGGDGSGGPTSFLCENTDHHTDYTAVRLSPLAKPTSGTSVLHRRSTAAPSAA